MTIRAKTNGGVAVAEIDADTGRVTFRAANGDSVDDATAALELTVSWADRERTRTVEDVTADGYASVDEDLVDWLDVVCGRGAVEVARTEEEEKAARGRVW